MKTGAGAAGEGRRGAAVGGLLGSAWELPGEEVEGDRTKPRAEGSSQDILLPHWGTHFLDWLAQ